MNEKITLQDIVNLFSQKQDIGKKEADLIVRTMFDLIEEALKTENYVKIKGFGTFKLTEVDARESVNVNTGERFEIQGHSKISFTPDTTMKDLNRCIMAFLIIRFPVYVKILPEMEKCCTLQ